MTRLSMNSNLNLSLKLYHKTKSNVFLSHIGDISIDIHYVLYIENRGQFIIQNVSFCVTSKNGFGMA